MMAKFFCNQKIAMASDVMSPSKSPPLQDYMIQIYIAINLFACEHGGQPYIVSAPTSINVPHTHLDKSVH